jgi:hypothetical protein
LAVYATALLAIAAGPRARADEPTSRPDQEGALREKANADMAAADWAEALPLWAKLYGLVGKPIDLWNAAVCQYHLAQAGQAAPEQAVVLLKQYRDSPAVSAEKKAKAQRYIDEMNALKQRRAEAAEAPPPPPARAAAPPAIVATTQLPAAAPPLEDDGSGKRAAAWIAGGLGTAALATGVYFSVKTRSLNDKVMSAGKFNPSDDSAGQSAQTLQYVMYGVGAAGIATGCVLYYLGSSRHERSSVAFAPMIYPGHSGAAVTVQF